jgi:periplasmic divalent cation tolerance protein
MNSNYIEVITTISSKLGAEKISEALIKERFSACVQIVGPINSIYRWKSKIEKTKEWLCIIKTRKALYKKVEKSIKKTHPYKVPEIIAIPITETSRDYSKWLAEETI